MQKNFRIEGKWWKMLGRVCRTSKLSDICHQGAAGSTFLHSWFRWKINLLSITHCFVVLFVRRISHPSLHILCVWLTLSFFFFFNAKVIKEKNRGLEVMELFQLFPLTRPLWGNERRNLCGAQELGALYYRN